METGQIYLDTVVQLDRWFETMRNADGYVGPVVHWWQNCLQYTGVGLDWRYEGIIIGYLNLFRRSSDLHWLRRAQQAANDLVRGQNYQGNFRQSNFEANPYTGGTPHEAACDLALLKIAQVLKVNHSEEWQPYYSAAERNLRGFIIDQLWNGQQAFFQDGAAPIFVCNKAATIVESLFAWSSLTDDETLLESYGLPTVEKILCCQVQQPGTIIDGAIDQSISARGRSGRYFPLYISRCIPALILAYRWTKDNRYLLSAQSAMNFVLRHRYPDGSFPQVIYHNGRIKRYPQWIAGVGDILRAMSLMQEWGMDFSLEPTRQWLLRGFQANGSCRTALGFASQRTQKAPPPLPDFRDLLPVCGWSDKAFRYLTDQVEFSETLPAGKYEVCVVPQVVHPVPGAAPPPQGIPNVPLKAREFKTSGLTVEIKPGKNDVVLEVKD